MTDTTILLIGCCAYFAIGVISYLCIAFYQSYVHNFDIQEDEDVGVQYVVGCLFWPVSIVLFSLPVIFVSSGTIVKFFTFWIHKIPIYLARQIKQSAARRAEARIRRLEDLRIATATAEEANLHLKR